MENKINDSCKGRGCRVIILTHDSRVEPVYSANKKFLIRTTKNAA